MGFSLEFNWVVVLKNDLPDEFRQYISRIESYGEDSPFAFIKEGHRIYPVGTRIPVAFDDKDQIVGSAMVESCELTFNDKTRKPETIVVLNYPQLD